MLRAGQRAGGARSDANGRGPAKAALDVVVHALHDGGRLRFWQTQLRGDPRVVLHLHQLAANGVKFEAQLAFQRLVTMQCRVCMRCSSTLGAENRAWATQWV